MDADIVNTNNHNYPLSIQTFQLWIESLELYLSVFSSDSTTDDTSGLKKSPESRDQQPDPSSDPACLVLRLSQYLRELDAAWGERADCRDTGLSSKQEREYDFSEMVRRAPELISFLQHDEPQYIARAWVLYSGSLPTPIRELVSAMQDAISKPQANTELVEAIGAYLSALKNLEGQFIQLARDTFAYTATDMQKAMERGRMQKFLAQWVTEFEGRYKQLAMSDYYSQLYADLINASVAVFEAHQSFVKHHG